MGSQLIEARGAVDELLPSPSPYAASHNLAPTPEVTTAGCSSQPWTPIPTGWTREIVLVSLPPKAYKPTTLKERTIPCIYVLKPNRHITQPPFTLAMPTVSP